jgi:hypothetical protein
MSDLKRYDNEVWDKFFEFISSADEALTRAEVQADLRRLGIDITRAFGKVKLALQVNKAKADLEAARVQRPRLIQKLRQVVLHSVEKPREYFQKLIAEKVPGTLQPAYYRKLESAASDEDLKSLFEDIERLDALSEEPDDVRPAAQ